MLIKALERYHSNFGIWLTSNFLILILIFISGCTYKMPKKLINNFTYKYSSAKKNLDQIVNTKGYYTERASNDFYMNYLFFEDGIAIENFYGSDRSGTPDKLPTFLANMVKDTIRGLKLWGTWGTYIISEDTIKAQFIHPSISLNDGWTGWEKHFKVIDRETIRLVYVKPLHHLSNSDRKLYTDNYYNKEIINNGSIIFIKSEAIPNPDCWMKKEKWFWKNEIDYENYIRDMSN
jgi:hypothetical protein